MSLVAVAWRGRRRRWMRAGDSGAREGLEWLGKGCIALKDRGIGAKPWERKSEVNPFVGGIEIDWV